MAVFTTTCIGTARRSNCVLAMTIALVLLLVPRLSYCGTDFLNCGDHVGDDGLTQPSGTPVCSSQDRQSLLLFKASISSDHNKALSNWKGSNCCSWNGVTCDGATGGVVRLKLPNQHLNGKLATSLSALAALQVLILDNNDFSGSIPSTCGKLTSLQRLCISNNPSLSGPIPVSFGQGFTSLQLLDVRSNALTGPLPSNFGGMSSLRKVHLYGNKINGTIPASFGMLSKLYTADLGNNLFSGRIPDAFGHGGLSSLLYLYLENNRITGLPAHLHNLTRLQWIDLSNNPLLNGHAVAGIATMPLISQIVLNSCSMSGPFPTWVSRLPHPDTRFLSDEVTPSLSLANNSITGPIPATVGKLTSLQGLNLQNNKLTGSIPASFANLKYLRSFNVSYNKLSREIPQVNPFTSFRISSYSPGNRGLCGTPLPDCKS